MPVAHSDRERGTRFATNVVWNFVGVITSLVSGLLLSPYLIRKIGAEGYGVWTLTFALVEYYWLLDLGFRSATVKYVAHHAALHEHERIREVISTALVYSSVAAALVLSVVGAAAPFVQRLFNIAPDYRSTFTQLVLIATLSWCATVVFGVFGASLEAAQRFDLPSRASVVGTVIRTAGTFYLLYHGHGLVALGILSAGSQMVTFGIHYVCFVRVFPHARPSPRHASRAWLRKMGGFGIHTFLGSMSQQALSQGAPLLIGYFLPAMFVGFFSLPVRLLMYTVEVVSRIGIVTNTNAAELSAHGDTSSLRQLGIYSNRYSLTLFMPLCIALMFYGDALFLRWVGADFARHSAPLLPILLLGNTLAIVGQFSSTMLLQGLGKHQRYARSLMVESIAGLILLWFVIPRYGILGAAWVIGVFMIVNRVFFTAWLTTRVLGMSVAAFLRSVYLRPIAAGLPAAALAWWAHDTFWPGTTWLQLALAGLGTGVVYYATAFFTLPAAHRTVFLGWCRKPLAMVWRRA